MERRVIKSGLGVKGQIIFWLTGQNSKLAGRISVWRLIHSELKKVNIS